MISPSENVKTGGRELRYHFDGATKAPRGKRWVIAALHPTENRAKIFSTKIKLSSAVMNLRRNPILASWYALGGGRIKLKLMATIDEFNDNELVEATTNSEGRLKYLGITVDSDRRTIDWLWNEMKNGRGDEVKRVPALRQYAEVVELKKRMEELERFVMRLAERILDLENRPKPEAPPVV